VRLRFRIPDTDQDEENEENRTADWGSEGRASEEPEEAVDLTELGPKALILGLGAAATQIFWPLPLFYLLAFALIGAATGLAYLLEIGRDGWIVGVFFYFLVDLFTPAYADVNFFLRTIFVMVAALGLTVGIGAMIQRARRNEDSDPT
jgi:hypothetical protein